MANTNIPNIPNTDVPTVDTSSPDVMVDASSALVPMADASTQVVPGPGGVTQSPTGHFFSLPMEIQTMFLQSLCPHCIENDALNKFAPCTDDFAWHARVALRQFCLVSRHARDLAQPILFHRLQVGKINKTHDFLEYPRLRSLLRLVRSMVMRPDLAAATRSIVLNMNMTVDLAMDEMGLTKNDRLQIMSVGDSMQMPMTGWPGMSPAEWTATPVTGQTGMQFVHEGFPRYANSLLIALASNATSLEILNCRRIDREFKNLMLWGSTQPTKTLKLKRLRVEGQNSDDDALAHVAPFLHLAPITELVYANACHFIHPGPIDPFLDVPLPGPLPVGAFASLKRLDLVGTKLKTADFKAAINACPNLENLSYLAWEPVYPSPAPAPGMGPNLPPWITVTPREVCDILSASSVRDTLQTLLMEFPREVEPHRSPGTIGSLRELTKLRYLALGGNVVSGCYRTEWSPDLKPANDPGLIHILPVDLQRLVIFNPYYHGEFDASDITELIDTLRDDLEIERKNTGVARPLVTSIDTLRVPDSRVHLMWPSNEGQNLSEAERRKMFWAKVLYSFNGSDFS